MAFGEFPPLTIRLVISPGPGHFVPDEDAIMRLGTEIESGQIIGRVGFNTFASISSPFNGVFVDFLAVTRQIIYKGQPVAWLLEPGLTWKG